MQASAGLLGACGVALAAAGAHRGGGELTAIAANFAILHAGAALGLSALVSQARRGGSWVLLSAGLMLIGTILFSGDLALAGLFGLRPWPLAAPLGGTTLIVAWLILSVAFTFRVLRPR